MGEAHSSGYTVHPGGTKMYQDLKSHFWWNGMKRDIADFVSRCEICQQVKAEHQRPGGLLQPLPIPQWKWDQIKTVNYLKRGFTGTLILNTVNGEVKIQVCSFKAKFVCNRLNETKKLAK